MIVWSPADPTNGLTTVAHGKVGGQDPGIDWVDISSSIRSLAVETNVLYRSYNKEEDSFYLFISNTHDNRQATILKLVKLKVSRR